MGGAQLIPCCRVTRVRWQGTGCCGLAGRERCPAEEGCCRMLVLSVAPHPAWPNSPSLGGSGVASHACLSQKYSAVTLALDSLSFFIFQFFFHLGLRSRERWWGRQPLCHMKSGGTQSATKPGGTWVEKAVKGLEVMPSPLDVPVLPAAFHLLGCFISCLGSAASFQIQPASAASVVSTAWFVLRTKIACELCFVHSCASCRSDQQGAEL